MPKKKCGKKDTAENMAKCEKKDTEENMAKGV